MVKGCEKRVVRVQNPENKCFEEVLFVLRDGVTERSVAERDIVAEANRILEENVVGRDRVRKDTRASIPFLLGAMTMTAILVPLLLLLR